MKDTIQVVVRFLFALLPLALFFAGCSVMRKGFKVVKTSAEATY
jgi:hypothetical protein